MTLQEGKRVVKAPPRKGDYKVNAPPQRSSNEGEHEARCIHEAGGVLPVVGAASAMAKFDSWVDSSLVLSVVTKVVVVEKRGCRGANKVGVGVLDDVLHDLGVGNKVGRVPDELGLILPACPAEGDGRRDFSTGFEWRPAGSFVFVRV